MSDPNDREDMGTVSGWARPDWSASVGAAPAAPTPTPAAEPPTATGSAAAVAPELPESPAEGGSARFGRRRLAVLGGTVAIVGLATFLLIGRGGGDPAVTGRIAAAFEAAGLTEGEASCVAHHVVDEMGTTDLDKVEDFNAVEMPANVSEGFPVAFEKALRAGIAACGVESVDDPNGA